MNITCPYCGHHSTIVATNSDGYWRAINIATQHLSYKHTVGTGYSAIACPNKKCKKLIFAVTLTKATQDGYGHWDEGAIIQTWPLLPESRAKPQPDYIPKAVVADYTEACRILELSPKSAAALARRTLQGMIRDFWGIKKDRLVDEVNELKDKVNTDTWDAIDAVRSVGNIGAHMEKDVNVIIDIEPDEATLLIELIEDLFKDWYVTRHDRQERSAALKKLADDKKLLKKQSKSVI